ncbi:MAG: thioredoxin family protein, partial [Candidatus Omnitrophica bacterium]|nr:thioredoxin family protein [Candidatus Omnitrophota bacterium]
MLLILCAVPVLWGTGITETHSSSEGVSPSPVQTNHAEADLISEVLWIQPGRPFWLALRLKMEKGWHTYWKNPGDSGLATTIEWTLPDGFQAGPIQWPYPERVEALPWMTFAYQDEVLLLTEITPSEDLNPSGEIEILARVQWLVCQVRCLPGRADLRLTLPVKNPVPEADSRWISEFANARGKLPLNLPEWHMKAGRSGGRTIRLEIKSPSWIKTDPGELFFFPDEGGVIEHSAPQRLQRTNGSYWLELTLAKTAVEFPKILKGVLVSEYGWRGQDTEKALRVEVPVESGTPQTAALGREGVTHLWMAVLFSFLGGIILNLMPCVLPVLALKILGFVKQAQDRSQTGLHGLIFTAGVLVSFWILGGFMLILRYGGQEIGWGFQLQSPEFVIFLAVLFFTFALNLFGVFEIGTSLTGVGGTLSRSSGWPGTFFSGVLATVVATPCTAPFMGSALGFALIQPPLISMTIFTFLGLGMAFPYLVLSIFPVLLKFVPKPGPWMIVLKKFMGILLATTVVWLAWILKVQKGNPAVTALALGLFILGIGVWIYGRWGSLIAAKSPDGKPDPSIRRRNFARAIAGLLVFLGYVFLQPSVGARFIASLLGTGLEGDRFQSNLSLREPVPFSPERLDQLRSEGRPVFLDFTAAWCLACQVNERVGLDF